MQVSEGDLYIDMKLRDSVLTSRISIGPRDRIAVLVTNAFSRVKIALPWT